MVWGYLILEVAILIDIRDDVFALSHSSHGGLNGPAAESLSLPSLEDPRKTKERQR